MQRFLTFIVCALLNTKIAADELDDKRVKAIQKLEVIANGTTDYITTGIKKLDDMVLYYDKIANTIYENGMSFTNQQLTNINDTASALTLQVMQGNGNQSVIQCIRTQQDKSITTIIGRVSAFESDVRSASRINNFEGTRTSLDLMNSGLPSVFERNKINLTTCVQEACFDNSLALASTQYGKIKANVDSLVTDLNTQEEKFGLVGLSAISVLYRNVTDDHGHCINTMNKCL